MPFDLRDYVLLGVTAYLLGSIPFALIVTALFKRSDLRSIGSGNLGIYNTMFNVGKLPALLALAGNAAVAATAVMLARSFFPDDTIALFTAITAVTVGSMWQLFVRFRGSRGTTTLGWSLMFALPLISAVLLAVWVMALLLRRRTTTATRVLHFAIPLTFGVVGSSWTFAAAGGLLATLLEVKCRFSQDDTLSLGLFRRFGLNDDR